MSFCHGHFSILLIVEMHFIHFISGLLPCLTWFFNWRSKDGMYSVGDEIVYKMSQFRSRLSLNSFVVVLHSKMIFAIVKSFSAQRMSRRSPLLFILPCEPITQVLLSLKIWELKSLKRIILLFAGTDFTRQSRSFIEPLCVCIVGACWSMTDSGFHQQESEASPAIYRDQRGGQGVVLEQLFREED